MVSPVTQNAASKFVDNREFSLLVETYLKEQVDVVLSTPVENEKGVMEALRQYHALNDFVAWIKETSRLRDE